MNIDKVIIMTWKERILKRHAVFAEAVDHGSNRRIYLKSSYDIRNY